MMVLWGRARRTKALEGCCEELGVAERLGVY